MLLGRRLLGGLLGGRLDGRILRAARDVPFGRRLREGLAELASIRRLLKTRGSLQTITPLCFNPTFARIPPEKKRLQHAGAVDCSPLDPAPGAVQRLFVDARKEEPLDREPEHKQTSN